ncbi:hypothetical protein [Enterococcus faecalis]|uniref:hypothetical protein n=1 Tax=Enterococcus faecalis TaxID=1351 RepID=UPI0039855986
MKTQTKKYAYFVTEDRQLPISQALKMKMNGDLIPSKENPVLFDFKNPAIRSAVFPVASSNNIKRPKIAHYKYYSTKDRKQIYCPKEMTNAHLFFQMMFLELKNFRVLDRDEKPILVEIASVNLEHYIPVDGSGGILLDVLINIKKTEPYSYSYLWNHQLAIEVKVTHAVDPQKKKVLREKNIATYEATVPRRIREKIPETTELLNDEWLRREKINELKKLYENEKWVLFGKFIVPSKVNEKNKEAYLNLSRLELEMKNYQQKLVSLTNEIETKRMRRDELQQNVNLLTNELLNYEKKVESNKKFLIETEKNSRLVNELSKELNDKTKELDTLKLKNRSLKKELDTFERENWFTALKRTVLK